MSLIKLISIGILLLAISTILGCSPKEKRIGLSMDEVGIENMPMFPGCSEIPRLRQKECSDKKMLDFIYSELKMPDLAIENGIVGTVLISFKVDKEGNLSDFKIVRDRLGDGCGEEALRVLKKMPKWISGKKLTGETFGLTMTLPIKFNSNH